jgi:hypothetical protein
VMSLMDLGTADDDDDDDDDDSDETNCVEVGKGSVSDHAGAVLKLVEHKRGEVAQLYSVSDRDAVVPGPKLVPP